MKKFWKIKDEKSSNNHINLDREQNRTEQNAGNLSGINQEPKLTSEIDNLREEINRLKNSSNPQQNLLKEKREELNNLEKKLKESNQKAEQQSKGSFEKQKVLQKQNNLNLYLGLGIGLLGLGLVGLIIYLITKKEKSR